MVLLKCLWRLYVYGSIFKCCQCIITAPINNHCTCWRTNPLITKHWLIRGTSVSVYIDHVTHFNRTTTVTIPTSIEYYTYYVPRNTTPLCYLSDTNSFPSTSHDWRHQISYFRSKGYGVLAPDLLGNWGSNKPLNVEDYIGSVMAKDIVSILDGEGNTGEIVGIAHDWGTYLLSKYALRITGWCLHNLWRQTL
jgi:hypothetical protein